MEDYSRQRHVEAGYEFVNSPHISKAQLFETSGHLGWFADGMFPPMELDGGQQYYLKPMNCPFHILIFKARQRSYRELPMRLFEFGTVYRYEKSGVVHGLTRVRGMTQDDAHIFCSREQMAAELDSLLTFVLDLLGQFGLDDFYLELSTRPPGKAVGSEEDWEEQQPPWRRSRARATWRWCSTRGRGLLRPQDLRAGARRHRAHAPDVDHPARLPEPQRFEMEYIGADNVRHRPIMIHRALFGSIERFMAILIEHYAGALPPGSVRAGPRPAGARRPRRLRLQAPRRAEGGGCARLGRFGQRAAGRAHPARPAPGEAALRAVVGDDDVAAATVGVNRRGESSPERGVAFADFLEDLLVEVAERATTTLAGARDQAR